MFETLQEFSLYAPVVIFIASTLDIFFATGLILYGAAMLSSIAMMYTAGMVTLEGIVISAYAGTLFGNSLNYAAGQLFGGTPAVAKKLEHPQIGKIRAFLQHRGLFLYMLVCRFIAITRPLYALALGGLDIKFKRFFFYESIIALAWVFFWLIVLMKGSEVYRYLFG